MSPPLVLDGLEEITAAVGRHLGYSDWLEVTQAQVDAFAAATGDGDPLADGYLALSLSNFFLPQIVEVRGVAAGLNYGAGRVRFPARLAVGRRIRGGARLVAAEPAGRGLQTTILITIEIDGADEPACVVESLSRWLA